MQTVFEHTGEIAALTAAFCWALSTVMYRPIGLSLSPLVMNLFKGGVAVALLCVTMGAGYLFAGWVPSGISGSVIVWLALSGVIGIGLGDTAFFASLRRIGSRRALLLGTLSPPMTAVIGLVFLGETPSLYAWLGIGLTVAGVAWVITERGNPRGQALYGRVWVGGVLGLVFAITQAAGAVISRKAMVDTLADPMLTALVRLAAGVLVVVVLIPLAGGNGRNRRGAMPAMTGRRWVLFFFAIVVGTYLGIWLQQVALDHTPAGVAQTLQSTSPLFVLPIAAVLGERVSLRAVVGAAVAVGGVVLLFSNG